MTNSQEKQPPQERNPVSKTFRCLEYILASPDVELGVRELAAEMNISPSSAHRILNGMVDEGYVTRNEATQRYGIGVGFMRLAYLSADRLPIRHIARFAMQKLVKERNETAMLGLYDATKRKMIFVAALESAHPLRYVVELNKLSPIHTGAMGLAVLAFLPEAERKAILSQKLEKLTNETITEAKALAPVIEQIRQQGHAMTSNQRVIGAVGIAAPFFGAAGNVIGGIGVILPKQRYEETDASDLTESVKSAATAITQSIGGSYRAVD